MNESLIEKLYALYYVAVAKYSNAVRKLESLEKARDAVAKLSPDRYDTSAVPGAAGRGFVCRQPVRGLLA